MRRLHLLFVFSLLAACAGPRLSTDLARKKIADLGSSQLVPDAIEIRRIISQSSDQAIAESTVTLAFQFKRDPKTGQWAVEAVRLGDRDWVNMAELMRALDDGRRRDTAASMEKLAAGLEAYRKANGSYPQSADIVELTDKLHPDYISELVRFDGWGRPLDVEVSGTGFRLISRGADGIRGTADDVILDRGTLSRP